MLEFQKEFFEQEVRDGFYLDATMKAVWSAELEVLQKVAEVCDRHGIKWYAAYGTLLGAIRHEGFVPWDDDMDIWVKRPDYNKLMKILPQELPEGYRVRSPLTEEGYEQFHTCVNSGSGISIAPDWLERFHGCPFTVGLDIFPLDYLPNDENERELQKQLFTMTGRVAQIAKNLGRGDYDKPKDEAEVEDNAQEPEMSLKDEMIEELRLGIEYLEENCNLHPDYSLLEEEKWNELSTSLWKWANYLAMMYNEEECDYIVEYLDYIKAEHKIYPKEWFADGYSATFENFMIPIPAGYDELLRFTYGDYFVRRKKIGSHEYPYYARQLRQLREYVKSVEQRVVDAGLVSIDDIEVKEESLDIPKEWEGLTLKKDGSRKKIVLSANDSVLYATYGNAALDRLEENLKLFECVKEDVLLWWRPQAVMTKQLELVSPELCERYKSILEGYKEAGWGICDETDNIDCAVANCDFYYGDLNAILQPFQEEGKPIMIAQIAEGIVDADEHNAARINEYRSFLSLADYAENGDKVYFSNTNYNGLVVANKNTEAVEELIPFAEVEPNVINAHLRCVKKDNRICFLPAGTPFVHIFDTEDNTQHVCKVMEDADEAAKDTWGYFDSGEEVFLLPSRSGYGLYRWNSSMETVEREDWWNIPLVEGALQHGNVDENCFYTLSATTSQLFITNVVTHTVEEYVLPDEKIQHITYDGKNFWYMMEYNRDIVCWNKEQGVVDRYQIPENLSWQYGVLVFLAICHVGGHLFLFSKYDQAVYVLDEKKREIQKIHSIQCSRGAFFAREIEPSFKCVGNKLICLLQNAGEVIEIDLTSLEVKQYAENFKVDENIHKADYYRLLSKTALLQEIPGEVDLSLLLKYCKEA